MAMEQAYYRKLWWQIILATLSFSVIPLFVLGVVIYQQFSSSYTAKIMENMKTLAENRCSSLDQLKDEDYLNRVFNIIQSRSKSYIDLGIIDQEGNHLAYVGPFYSVLKG